jgi:hypothetical protein
VASISTYHSFNDIELFEPPSPPKRDSAKTRTYSSDSLDDERPMTAVKMQRQDSGYESYGPSPSPRSSTSTSASASASPSRKPTKRRVSNASSTASPQVRKRPSTKRSAKSYPLTRPTQSLHHRCSGMPIQVQPVSYFQFPSVEPIEMSENMNATAEEAPPSPLSPISPLPQTTHYWTSDSTRRLEYAAIDAASRGFKGWVRRTLVPDCFVPQDSRHVAFDDDTGSVRRYRLELEDDVHDEKSKRPRRPWSFWRKNTV